MARKPSASHLIKQSMPTLVTVRDGGANAAHRIRTLTAILGLRLLGYTRPAAGRASVSKLSL